MDIRQWDPSPATATGYRRRPKLHPAGEVAEIPNGAGANGTATAGSISTDSAAASPQAGRPASARRVKPGLAKSPRMAVLGARAAPSGGYGMAGGFAPPVTAPTASRAPSHATSAAS
jgi:hypothetical protein